MIDNTTEQSKKNSELNQCISVTILPNVEKIELFVYIIDDRFNL